jgi:5-(carboxyamino)imidazole ribonucleotide mutase
MGSKSDWASLKKSAEILKKLKIKYNVKIVSAHRTPMRLVEFAKSAKKK